jgi:hypothetical protein
MEKHRFYVELPGDFWESGVVMSKLKMNLPHRTAEGRIEHWRLLQEGQVTPELILPPHPTHPLTQHTHLQFFFIGSLLFSLPI